MCRTATSKTLPIGVKPIDFSFLELEGLESIQNQRPRVKPVETQVTKKVFTTIVEPELEIEENSEDEDQTFFAFGNSDDAENGEKGEKKKIIAKAETKSETRKVYIATAIKFNNNKINNISDIYKDLTSILQNTNWLCWIDLSFNKLKLLSADFSQFKELRLIYLHGNQISDFKEIENLKKVTLLKSLTLHGNIIETDVDMNKFYRKKVLEMLPGLQNFDFSCVTDREKRDLNQPILRRGYGHIRGKSDVGRERKEVRFSESKMESRSFQRGKTTFGGKSNTIRDGVTTI